jgi:hypothetical protein
MDDAHDLCLMLGSQVKINIQRRRPIDSHVHRSLSKVSEVAAPSKHIVNPEEFFQEEAPPTPLRRVNNIHMQADNLRFATVSNACAPLELSL